MRFSSLSFILLAITLTSAAPINKAELQPAGTGAGTGSLVARSPEPFKHLLNSDLTHLMDESMHNWMLHHQQQLQQQSKRDPGSGGIPISHNAAMQFQRLSHTRYKPSNKLWKRDPKTNLVHWSVTLDGVVPSSLFQFDDLTDGPEVGDREKKSSHH